MGRREDLDHFYVLLGRLRQQVGGARLLADPQAGAGLPRLGVYFFFEPGELREDGTTPRVVRVGTHAVSENSKTTLWQRLSQHRGRLGGRHAGGGNHRGSIFRLHVGTALINLGTADAAAAAHWDDASSSGTREWREAEQALEMAVSQHIRSMPFLWVAVPDPPSKHSHRKLIEANAIALLSNLDKPAIDPPSAGWLGRWADRPAVRGSGLWNVNHVDEAPEQGWLAVLERYIGDMSAGEALGVTPSGGPATDGAVHRAADVHGPRDG